MEGTYRKSMSASSSSLELCGRSPSIYYTPLEGPPRRSTLDESTLAPPGAIALPIPIIKIEDCSKPDEQTDMDDTFYELSRRESADPVADRNCSAIADENKQNTCEKDTKQDIAEDIAQDMPAGTAEEDPNAVQVFSKGKTPKKGVVFKKTAAPFDTRKRLKVNTGVEAIQVTADDTSSHSDVSHGAGSHTGMATARSDTSHAHLSACHTERGRRRIFSAWSARTPAQLWAVKHFAKHQDTDEPMKSSGPTARACRSTRSSVSMNPSASHLQGHEQFHSQRPIPSVRPPPRMSLMFTTPMKFHQLLRSSKIQRNRASRSREQPQSPDQLVEGMEHDSPGGATVSDQQNDDDTISHRQRLFRTGCLGAQYFTVGLCFAILGPTLLDIEQFNQVSAESSALLFTARAGGGVIGSLLVGLVFDRYNQYMLIAGCLILAAATTAIFPLFSFWFMLTIALVKGLVLQFLNCGTSVMCVYLWGSKNAPYMQATHFLFGLGSIMGPLLAEPFLLYKSSSLTQTAETMLNKTRNATFIKLTNMNSSYDVTTEFQSYTTFTATRNPISDEDENSSYQIAYYITASVFLIFGLVFGAIWLLSERYIFLERPDCMDDPDVSTGGQKSESRFCIVMVGLMVVFEFMHMGSELVYQNLIVSVAVKGIGWTISSASYVNSVFYLSFTFGRGLGIWLAHFLSPTFILVSNLILALVGLTVELAFAQIYPPVLWISGLLLGLGMSTVLPSSFTWLETHIDMTSRVASSLMIGADLGMMTLPAMTGVLFEIYGFEVFDGIQLSATVVKCGIFAVMYILGRRHQRLTSSFEVNNISGFEDMDDNQNSVKATPWNQQNQQDISCIETVRSTNNTSIVDIRPSVNIGPYAMVGNTPLAVVSCMRRPGASGLLMSVRR